MAGWQGTGVLVSPASKVYPSRACPFPFRNVTPRSGDGCGYMLPPLRCVHPGSRLVMSGLGLKWVRPRGWVGVGFPGACIVVSSPECPCSLGTCLGCPIPPRLSQGAREALDSRVSAGSKAGRLPHSPAPSALPCSFLLPSAALRVVRGVFGREDAPFPPSAPTRAPRGGRNSPHLPEGGAGMGRGPRRSREGQPLQRFAGEALEGASARRHHGHGVRPLLPPLASLLHG